MHLNVLYNKSSLDMSELPSNSIDLTLTDFPWNVGKNYGVYKDSVPWPDYWNSIESSIKEISRVMRPGYFVFSFFGKTMWTVKPLVEQFDWQFVQMLIWFHPNGYGGQNQHFWNHRYEPILVFKRSGAPPLLKGGYFTNVIVEPSLQSNYKKEPRFHPAQKPVRLYEKLLSKLPGVIVLDPFAGSGAVLRAAKRQDRHFIGYEIDPRSAKLARKALQTESSLWDKTTSPSFSQSQFPSFEGV